MRPQKETSSGNVFVTRATTTTIKKHEIISVSNLDIQCRREKEHFNWTSFNYTNKKCNRSARARASGKFRCKTICICMLCYTFTYNWLVTTNQSTKINFNHLSILAGSNTNPIYELCVCLYIIERWRLIGKRATGNKQLLHNSIYHRAKTKITKSSMQMS